MVCVFVIQALQDISVSTELATNSTLVKTALCVTVTSRILTRVILELENVRANLDGRLLPAICHAPA